MTRRWFARAGAALRLPGLVLALAGALPAAPGAQQVIVVLPPPPSVPPAPGPERIVLRTIGGDIVIALYPGVAPQTVRQMLLLTRAGVYDTTYFFRADPQGFYLQLSDARNRLLPLTAAQAALIHPLKAEWGRLRHVRGVVSMGRSPHQPDSALTSFMIIRKDAPFLDQPGDTYTIFGRVERGMDVVDALAGTKHDADGNPEFRLTILRALALDPAGLAALPLRGVESIDTSLYTAQKPPVLPPSERLDWISAGAFGLILVLTLAAFILVRRLPGSRQPNALALMAMAVAGYMLLVLLTPVSWSHAWVGVGLLALTLAIIRLLAFFEG